MQLTKICVTYVTRNIGGKELKTLALSENVIIFNCICVSVIKEFQVVWISSVCMDYMKNTSWLKILHILYQNTRIIHSLTPWNDV